VKILVPIDGSRHCAESLKVAASFAAKAGAKAYVIYVTPSISDIDLELSASERDRLLESMKKRGEDILRKGADALRSAGARDINSVLATAESVAQEIVTYAEREKIDLIVIGGKGAGASARFPLGGTAARVVRHSPCSVHVVKEQVI
jgi:nucleotide-binding universal stress UspA family protein